MLTNEYFKYVFELKKSLITLIIIPQAGGSKERFVLHEN